MRIGITERGDAGINLKWNCKMNNLDGAILITKNITEPFKRTVLALQKPAIIHCTCTGWGGTEIEPNVPNYKTQLDNLKDLIDKGFPAKNCVLRIDPIFPNELGLKRVEDVINYFISLNTNVKRIRISILDEYKHVKERFKEHNWMPLYGDNFYASYVQFQNVAKTLSQYQNYTFETCAEDKLSSLTNNIIINGCISKTDLDLMNIPYDESLTKNPQNRTGCHCLSCKTELLDNRHPCPHKCVYCFWKD